MSIPTYNFTPSIKIGYDVLEELHEFKQGNCYASLRKVSPVEFSLETFQCNNQHARGEGRQLLLYVLNWVKENYKDITDISLTAVPEILTYLKTDTLADREKKQQDAMRSLTKYYTALGFKSINEEEFMGNIDDIIGNINGFTRGGKKTHNTTRRRTKNKQLFVLKKGELTKYGYHAHLSDKARRKSLKKALAGGIKPLSLFRKLNAVYVLNKNKHKQIASIYKKDANWTKTTKEYKERK